MLPIVIFLLMPMLEKGTGSLGALIELFNDNDKDRGSLRTLLILLFHLYYVNNGLKSL